MEQCYIDTIIPKTELREINMARNPAKEDRREFQMHEDITSLPPHLLNDRFLMSDQQLKTQIFLTTASTYAELSIAAAAVAVFEAQVMAKANKPCVDTYKKRLKELKNLKEQRLLSMTPKQQDLKAFLLEKDRLISQFALLLLATSDSGLSGTKKTSETIY